MSKSRHNTIVLVGKETAYGIAQTTPEHKFPDQMEWDYGVSQIEIPQKTQTLEPQSNESKQGRKAPTVTLRGVLTADHEWLLQAYFNKTASAYGWQTSDGGFSYTIMQAYPASSSDAGDGIKAVGCRMESLTINRNGEYVGYEATFRAKSITDNSDFSTLTLLTITDVTYPDQRPFLFQDITTVSLIDGAVTAFNTFSLTLNNEFADDDISFQNSQTRTIDTVCSTSGELSYTYIYTMATSARMSAFYDDTLGADNFSITDGTNTWAITTYGQYSAFSRPDEDKCIYTGDVTKMLMGDATYKAITITVS
jgi:hypothetical protein